MQSIFLRIHLNFIILLLKILSIKSKDFFNNIQMNIGITKLILAII